MDQLDKIREEQRKRYLRDTWLPKITEKYQKLFDPKNKAAYRIQKFLKKNFFHDVVNPDLLFTTPGLFRYRVRLTSKNLEKPEEINESSQQQKNPNDFRGDQMKIDIVDSEDEINIDYLGDDDIDLKDIMVESFKNYKQQHENDLSKIVEESINQNMSYDDIILNQVLLESNTAYNQEVGINDDIMINQSNYEETNDSISSFYICLDLRYYGPEPYHPIYHNICHEIPWIHLSNIF